MATASDQLPDNVDELKTALIETRAKLSGAEAMIEHLQLVIAKMKREMFGPRSERSQRILDQLELQLEELAAAAGEDATKVETASVHVKGFTRRKATRRNFPADLPRLYDFGDGWKHTIKIERLTDTEPGVMYPRLIAATGRCPPEDCGGPWGYAEFLDAIRDPAHERHAELKEWIGCDFDPDNVDREELAAHVAMLAKQWARTQATRRTRRA